MKTMLAAGMAGLMIATTSLPTTAQAGGREWATAGKILTGAIVAGVILDAFTPRPAVAVCQPQQVVYQAPQVVYTAPQVVYPAQQVVYVTQQPQPVYVERVYVPSYGCYDHHREYHHYRDYDRHR